MEIRKILTNNEELLENLIDLYSYDVYKMAFFYLKNKEKAEDITQEVFLICYEKLPSYRGDLNGIKYWLLRITANKCKDLLGSWSYKYLKITDVLTESLRSSQPSPEEIACRNNEKSQLINYLLKLNVKYREVIWLYYYEELKLHEISNILEVNQNTVKTRLRRGKDQLKRLIKEDK